MGVTPTKIVLSPNHLHSPWLHQEKMHAAGWQLVQCSSRQAESVYYDTFDWLAFENGMAVIKKEGSLYITALHSGSETAYIPFRGNPTVFFPSRLPECKLKKLLGACGDMRAFIKLCVFTTLSQTYSILDGQNKTIGTFFSESWHLAEYPGQNPFCQGYALKPLKGFSNEVEELETWLSSNYESRKIVEYRDLYLILMKEAGLNVKGYASKIHLQLDKHAMIHENARRMLQSTFTLVKQNETGISRDIDTEFLHDYRVAIRRSRSVLMLLKGVFNPEESAYFLNALKDIGERTNELRDMDVYLLHQTNYLGYLPPVLQPPLKEFFSEITAKRNKLHKEFCSHLASIKYRSFLKEWDEWINKKELPSQEKAPNATLATSTIAEATIKKAWKKVIRDGRKIGRKTTDKELHTLRIDCKKLRYLLEFFSSIFPNKTIAPIIRQLKELQENLGNFTDFSVQISFLEKRLVLMETEKKHTLLAATTGGLIAILYQKQEETRRKFHDTFRGFDDEQTAKFMHELLTFRKENENNSTL